MNEGGAKPVAEGGGDDVSVWWPTERSLRRDSSMIERCRRPRSLQSFAAARAAVDERLAAVATAPITDGELLTARMYTGPMYEKYCAVLRGVAGRVPALTRQFETLCQGNTYRGTIQTINGALIKLARISTISKLYRGVSGFGLPQAFLAPDEHGVRGGVELGFLSATMEREVAVQYAAGDRGGLLLEIEQAMGDRGADISWLSQYPHEKEVCFPPVLGLEVVTHADGVPVKRTEGAVVVIQLRPSTSRGSGIRNAMGGSDSGGAALLSQPLSYRDALRRLPSTSWQLLSLCYGARGDRRSGREEQPLPKQVAASGKATGGDSGRDIDTV